MDELTIIKSVLAKQSMLVLEKAESSTNFKVVGGSPFWFDAIQPGQAATYTDEDLVQIFPFMPVFFDMVNVQHEGSGSKPAESMVWSLSIDSERDFHFSCSLFRQSGSTILTIKELGTAFIEHQKVMDGNRANKMKLDALEEKVEHLFMALKAIMYDVETSISGLQNCLNGINKSSLNPNNSQSISIATRQVLKLDSLFKEIIEILKREKGH